MTRQERLDIGQKIFVAAFVGSVVIEVLLTLFAISVTFTWTTVLLGAVFVGFLLYLANWLYSSGNLTAWKTAVAWGVFQVLLSIAVIVAFLASHNHPGFAKYIGMPVIWLAIIKAVTYAAFAGFLALPQPVHDFLGLRRGETPPAEVETAEVPLSGVTVPLTDAEAAAFGSLTGWMQWAGGLLIAAGVLRFFVGLQNIEPVANLWFWLPGLPYAIEGVAVAILGVFLLMPAAALALFKSRDMNHLMNALKSLQALYFAQTILVAVSAVAVVIGIVAKFL
jgi:hypothetical protein